MSAQAQEVRRHHLFDVEWYLRTYPEVAAANIDPIEHYLTSGAERGYDPNPFFDTDWYIAKYPKAAASGLNPLLHFIRNGATEPLDPGPNFDTAWYVTENPEVAGAGLIPLERYLTTGRPQNRTVRPEHASQAFESLVRAERSGLLPSTMRSKLKAAASPTLHVPLHRRADTPDGALPMPPPDLASRIGSPTIENFDHIGRGTRRTLGRCLPPGFSFRNARSLDFGCGVGRVIRHLEPEAREGEVWGCDIDGMSMRWLVENLSPPFRFFQLGDAPKIPLESSSFDLVYAIGVFSQINTDWHHWALELRRVLRPGGTLIMTFAGQTPFEEMLSSPYHTPEGTLGMYVKNPLNSWNRGGPMVFMSPRWVQTFWGSIFDIDFIALDGLLDYQSICVARKPAAGAPIKTDVPVLALGTTQAFNADAAGKIFGRFDETLPFRDSFGIETAGDTEIEGWIAFRGDEPESGALFVDDDPVSAPFSWAPGQAYRDWGAPRTAFAAAFDASRFAPGVHRLRIETTSRTGLRHTMSIPLVTGVERSS